MLWACLDTRGRYQPKANRRMCSVPVEYLFVFIFFLLFFSLPIPTKEIFFPSVLLKYNWYTYHTSLRIGSILLATFKLPHSHTNYNYHVVHYILSSYLFYNCKFVPFDYLHTIKTTPTSGNHKPDFFFYEFVFQVPHISGIIQYDFVWFISLSIIP